MAHHHKSNQTVEGDPDTGHGRGMPRRPDEEELEELTEDERIEAGLDPDPEKGAAARRRGEGAEGGDGDG